MAYPEYLRAHARRLRTQRNLTLDEVAERLPLLKTTVWSWIRDLPLGRPRDTSKSQRLATAGMQAKYEKVRRDAYAEGRSSFAAMAAEPTFRDFVVLYIAEGYKRNGNVVSICNSDGRVVALAHRWIRTLSQCTVTYSLQYHADQELTELRRHWGELLGIDGAAIRLQRKSNSGQLKGRSWRSEHGVLTIGVNDTPLRARLQGWIDELKDRWG